MAFSQICPGQGYYVYMHWSTIKCRRSAACGGFPDSLLNDRPWALIGHSKYAELHKNPAALKVICSCSHCAASTSSGTQKTNSLTEAVDWHITLTQLKALQCTCAECIGLCTHLAAMSTRRNAFPNLLGGRQLPKPECVQQTL